jgi:hypothetical protein
MAITRKKNRERYRFTLFLLANGFAPYDIAGWVLAGDVRTIGGDVELLQDPGYDAKAKEQIRFLVHEAVTGTLWSPPRTPCSIYDMSAQRVLTIQGNGHDKWERE